jgi:hypothetical protein
LEVLAVSVVDSFFELLMEAKAREIRNTDEVMCLQYRCIQP